MNNCDSSINEKLAISATNYVRKLMNVDGALWVFINDGDMFKSVNHSGMFQKDTFVIRYNREWLKTADQEKIVRCAFHEVFHVVQYTAIVRHSMGIKNTQFTDDEINQLEHEFKDENYDDSNGTWGSHLVEQQAEWFAVELYNRFVKQYKDTDEFIVEYFDMYPNIE